MAHPSPTWKAKGRYVSDEEMKDFLRMRLQPKTEDELPAVEKRKALRKAFKLSQRELAEQLGVALSTVSAWEVGRNEPRGDVRRRYLAFCRAAEEVLKEIEGTKEGGNTNGTTDE